MKILDPIAWSPKIEESEKISLTILDEINNATIDFITKEGKVPNIFVLSPESLKIFIKTVVEITSDSNIMKEINGDEANKGFIVYKGMRLLPSPNQKEKIRIGYVRDYI